MDKSPRNLAITLVCLSLVSFGLGPATSAKPANVNQQAEYHRLDFRVEGASCVTCLRRIGQTFRDTRGVIKADVSIYRPYWAIIIYDAKQTNLNRLNEAIKTEHVKLVEVQDKAVPQVPAVIVPKALSGAG
jgi:hypothetical protein